METMMNEIPRSLTALAEWGACMMFLMYAPLRFEKWKTWGISFLYLIGLMVFLILTGGEKNMLLWWLYMLIAMASIIGFFALESKLEVRQVLYFSMLSFLVAEFMASVSWIITAMALLLGVPFRVCFVLSNVMVLLLCVLAYYLERHIITEDYLQQITTHENIATFSMVALVFAFSNMGFVVNDYFPTDALGISDISGLLRTFMDFCGIAILYAYQSRIREYMAEKESSSMQALLRSQYEQYRYYQSTQEMIHIKYHDLKHQITGLRAETDVEKRKEWLDRLERELDENHLVDRTGNQVLDTILGAKIFQGQKIHARFTCVCDGKLLDHMHVTDICTIFGNALDNALEAVAMIEDPEQRLIHLTIKKNKKFILINVMNYCGDVEDVEDMTEGGHLKTSKYDKENHGFGIKSIRYTVEKYGGTLNIDRKNGWFGLHMLIPEENEI